MVYKNCCPDGYECNVVGTGKWVTVSQLAAIDHKLADQSFEINKLKLKKIRKWGWTAGAGVTLGPEFNSGDTGIAGVMGGSLVWGWRFGD